MNKVLANGHENGQETPATAMPEADPIFLRDVPLIVEAERWIAEGRGWSRDFDARVEEISIALFGVTEADTHVVHPQEEQFLDQQGRRVDRRAFDAAWAVWRERDLLLTPPCAKSWSIDEIDDWWWSEHGVDVLDENDFPLRCLDRFSRQLLAAINSVLAASLTLDGSGVRGPQAAEAWGAALAKEAAQYGSRTR